MKKINHLPPKLSQLKILTPNEILGSTKPHIVIDQSCDKYTLLDSSFHEIDTKKQISALNIFSRKHKLKSFKKVLKKDLHKYKKTCRLLHNKPDKSFIKMHKDILFYLKICPDADYCILELLRKNIVQMNIGYSNYQSACAEYLRELAKLYDGDPSLLPFDINFATTNNKVSTKHKYISNTFLSYSRNPVDDFIRIFKKPRNDREAYIKSHSYYAPDISLENQKESKYCKSKKVKTDESISREQ